MRELIVCSLLCAFVLSGCGPGQLFAATLTPTSTTTLVPTAPPTFTKAPSSLPSLTPKRAVFKEPTETITATLIPKTPNLPPTIPAATQSAMATIESFGNTCVAPAQPWDSQMSSDGNWISVVCRGASWAKDGSYLHVFSVNGKESWRINYLDFAGEAGSAFVNDMFYPFHWSKNGKYLYAFSPTSWDGWIGLGPGGLALVRLNLKTGQTTEIVNCIEESYLFGRPQLVSFSFSPGDNYLLYILQEPSSDGTYKIIILDLKTWRTSDIELENSNLSGAGFAVWSEDEDKIILLTQEPAENGDCCAYSLVLVNLDDSSQTTLITNMESGEQLYPVNWVDEYHVELTSDYYGSSDTTQWLLDIRTKELKEITNPQ